VKEKAMGAIEDVRGLLQDFVAPELREIGGKIEGLDARVTALEKVMSAQFSVVNAKLDSLLAIHSIEQRLARLEAQRAQQ
jgi:hypothetical protein